MIKKIVSIIVMIVIIMVINIGITEATTVNEFSAATTSNTVKTGDEVAVTLSIKSVESTGLIAIGGYIGYDKEMYSIKSITSENGWSSVTYNDETSKFVTNSSDPKKAGNILKVVFSVIGTKTGAGEIKFTNIEATNDDDIEAKSADVSVSIDKKTEEKNTNTTENIAGNTIGHNTAAPTTNTNPDKIANTTENIAGNTIDTTNVANTVNTTSNISNATNELSTNISSSVNNDKTTSYNKIPKTGASNVIALIIIGIVSISIVLYVKLKK